MMEDGGDWPRNAYEQEQRQNERREEKRFENERAAYAAMRVAELCQFRMDDGAICGRNPDTTLVAHSFEPRCRMHRHSQTSTPKQEAPEPISWPTEADVQRHIDNGMLWSRAARIHAMYEGGRESLRLALYTADQERKEAADAIRTANKLRADLALFTAMGGPQRDSVRWFASVMERELRVNDHKGGWESERIVDLLNRVYDEAHELNEAINCPGGARPERIIKEAADVANFAMMIADNERIHSTPTAAERAET